MRVLRWLAAAGLSVFLSVAGAQTAYPTKPITIVYPYAVGSAPEAILRQIAQHLSTKLGQPVIVDAKPGAAGTIGGSFVARAPADGHTLLFGDSGGVYALASLRATAPYDSRTAFAPITKVAFAPAFLVVGANSPIRSLQELVQASNQNPQGLSFGSNGVGSMFHLAIERLAQLTHTQNLVHVPFKGSPETNQALVGGHIDFALNGGLLNIKAGRARALAVASPKRAPQLPDVPTFAEATGIAGYSETEWWSLAAPAGTPPDVIARLNRAVAEIVTQPEFQARFADLGYEFAPGTPEELRGMIREGIDKWKKVATESRIDL